MKGILVTSFCRSSSACPALAVFQAPEIHGPEAESVSTARFGFRVYGLGFRV